ncbi:MAG: shikimate dehydrogenase [Clostridiales Family XIII bacterium]|jgi:shikimate dehydrogenase|nr:shikimate dehydrogenase [Clostridiales Family XIII bacterium]
MVACERYAVIGFPLEHTLSPAIHNSVFSKLDVPAIYEKAVVKKSELEGFCRDETLQGFNVTIPHKEAIVKFLSRLEEDAKISGAVNTVLRTPTGLLGYNTDMQGLLLAIRRLGFDYKDSRIAVIGSGGAAVGVVIKAAMEGAKSITIIARNEGKAEAIRAKAIAAKNVDIQICRLAGLAYAEEKFDILVNATPLGMGRAGDDFQDFSFLKSMTNGALVYDMVYNNWETGLIREAKAQGLVTGNGLSMLVSQALLADGIFLGDRFPEERAGEIFEQVYNEVVK